jgi:hypothetical protein
MTVESHWIMMRVKKLCLPVVHFIGYSSTYYAAVAVLVTGSRPYWLLRLRGLMEHHGGKRDILGSLVDEALVCDYKTVNQLTQFLFLQIPLKLFLQQVFSDQV